MAFLGLGGSSSYCGNLSTRTSHRQILPTPTQLRHEDWLRVVRNSASWHRWSILPIDLFLIGSVPVYRASALWCDAAEQKECRHRGRFFWRQQVEQMKTWATSRLPFMANALKNREIMSRQTARRHMWQSQTPFSQRTQRAICARIIVTVSASRPVVQLNCLDEAQAQLRWAPGFKC